MIGQSRLSHIDNGNHRIRKISPLGSVTTLAGSGDAKFADGTGTKASFYNPLGVAVDAHGNCYVADMGTNVRQPYLVQLILSFKLFLACADFYHRESARSRLLDW